MKKIGMRNIKTALAVFICVITLGYIKKGFPFFTCIAAIITMDNTIYNSFKIGKNRIIGTTLGALVGLIFSLAFPPNATSILFLVPIGISITIYLCDNLGYKKSISIACIVFIAIINNSNNTNLILYSLNRLTETIFGILVAVLINYLIYPPNLKKQIFDSNRQIHKDLFLICEEDFHKYDKNKLEKLYSHIKELESSICSYKEEYKSYNDSLNLKKYKHAISLFYKLYAHLIVIQEIKDKGPLIDNINKILQELDDINML